MSSLSQLSLLDRLLLKNSTLLEHADRWINFLPAVVPGEGPAIEVGVESLISSTALLNIYKKQLLIRLIKPKEKPLMSRFIDAEYKAHKSYRVLAYILSIIKSGEVLFELAARSYSGEKGQWRTILGLESLKAIIRLALFAISKKVNPSAIPVHDMDMTAEEIDDLFANENSPVNIDEKSTYNLLNLNEKRPSLKAPSKDNIIAPLNLLRNANLKLMLSEILYIVRPVVYASLLYKYRAAKADWTPWTIGILIEIVSREVARSALKSSPLKTTLEKEVYSSRDHELLGWLLRGAMYNNRIGPLIRRVRNGLEKIPLINMATLFIDDYLYYLDDFYFASASL